MARSRWLVLLLLLPLLAVGLLVLRFAFSPATTKVVSLVADQDGDETKTTPDLLCSLDYTPSNRIDPPANARVILALWSDGAVIGYVGGSYRSGQIDAARLGEIRESLTARSVGLVPGNYFPPDSEWYELRVLKADGTTLRTAWNLHVDYLPNATAGPFAASWAGITTEMMLLSDELDVELTDDSELLERARRRFPTIR